MAGTSLAVTCLVKSKGRFTSWTIKSDHGRWSFAMVQLDGPIFTDRFLKKNKIIKSLGPSLSVNRMWINRNDHASKSECVDFF